MSSHPSDGPTHSRGATERPLPHVLVVDDEVFIRETFKIFLEGNNLRVSTAASGEEALEVFRRERPQVIVLDLLMPGMHGLEVLRRLKQIDSGVEVVIATGCGSVHSAVEALSLGAFDYITKPILDLEHDLLDVLRDALAAREAAQASAPRAGVDGAVPAGARVILEQLEDLARRLRAGVALEELGEVLWAVLRRCFAAEGAALLRADPPLRLLWGLAAGPPLETAATGAGPEEPSPDPDPRAAWMDGQVKWLRTRGEVRTLEAGNACLCLLFAAGARPKLEEAPRALVQTLLEHALDQPARCDLPLAVTAPA